jgi:transposase
MNSVWHHPLQMARKSREHGPEIRSRIIELVGQGRSIRNVADALGIPKSTVHDIVTLHRQSGSVHPRPRCGRKPLVTERLTRLVVRMVKRDRAIAATTVAQRLAEDHSVEVTPQTVRNLLRRNGYASRVARRKPFLSCTHMARRLQFAREFQRASPVDWGDVLFTDESKFNICGSDGRTLVWRKPGEEYNLRCIKGTVKYGGGSVMVWGSMSRAGVGELIFIDGIMDALMYCDILRQGIPQSVQRLGLPAHFVFQQDNDPKHTSRLARSLLGDQMNIRVLPWPSQSPDLNPIEHLWDYVSRQLKKRSVSSKAELKAAIQDEWSKVPRDFCRRLVESMPRRLAAVIRNKGGPTKY